MTEAPQWFGDAAALAEAVVREVGIRIAFVKESRGEAIDRRMPRN